MASAARRRPIRVACKATRRGGEGAMTWSLIARDPATSRFGIAVATKNFAVGCRVPNIASGIGAVATQALSNPFYGVDGIRLLQEGKTAAEVVTMLVASDDGRAHRQLH